MKKSAAHYVFHATSIVRHFFASWLPRRLVLAAQRRDRGYVQCRQRSGNTFRDDSSAHRNPSARTEIVPSLEEVLLYFCKTAGGRREAQNRIASRVRTIDVCGVAEPAEPIIEKPEGHGGCGRFNVSLFQSAKRVPWPASFLLETRARCSGRLDAGNERDRSLPDYRRPPGRHLSTIMMSGFDDEDRDKPCAKSNRSPAVQTIDARYCCVRSGRGSGVKNRRARRILWF